MREWYARCLLVACQTRLPPYMRDVPIQIVSTILRLCRCRRRSQCYTHYFRALSSAGVVAQLNQRFFNVITSVRVFSSGRATRWLRSRITHKSDDVMPNEDRPANICEQNGKQYYFY